MSDILSPEEVDALLTGVSRGQVATSTGVGVDTADVSEYDLTSNEHITRDRTPSMTQVNQVFARYLTTGAQGLLKTTLEVSAGESAVERYGDFIAGLEMPTSLNLVRATDLDTQLLFVLDASLVLNFVDLSFGGGGTSIEISLGRDFTPTETGVTRRLLRQALADYRRAWESIRPLDLEPTQQESNPEFANFFASNEELVVSRFEVVRAEHPLGTLVVGIPSTSLEPVKELLDASDLSETRARWKAMLERQLLLTEVELSSVLTTASLRLSELVRLKPGDIVPVDIPTSVELLAGEVRLFKGAFGTSNGHNAIRITERLTEDTPAPVGSTGEPKAP